ncbi:hypothetical protein C8R43DRAFT_1190684 [Mycena crocata]|nr:hypothetical protein C8R43DRAFT_1190684 [Mycena crocata]
MTFSVPIPPPKLEYRETILTPHLSLRPARIFNSQLTTLVRVRMPTKPMLLAYVRQLASELARAPATGIRTHNPRIDFNPYLPPNFHALHAPPDLEGICQIARHLGTQQTPVKTSMSTPQVGGRTQKSSSNLVWTAGVQGCVRSSHVPKRMEFNITRERGRSPAFLWGSYFYRAHKDVSRPVPSAITRAQIVISIRAPKFETLAEHYNSGAFANPDWIWVPPARLGYTSTELTRRNINPSARPNSVSIRPRVDQDKWC